MVYRSLLLVIWGMVDFSFISFFCGVGVCQWLALEFLVVKFYLTFSFFLNIFKSFLNFFFLGETLVIFFQHSLIQSHNFFVYCWDV